jgi:hypothetical protein
MKKYLLAATAALARGGSAYADHAPTAGKSRLEVAKDLAEDCRSDIEWGLVPKGTHIEDCVTARLRTLDNAIRRAAGGQ